MYKKRIDLEKIYELIKKNLITLIYMSNFEENFLLHKISLSLREMYNNFDLNVTIINLAVILR